MLIIGGGVWPKCHDLQADTLRNMTHQANHVNQSQSESGSGELLDLAGKHLVLGLSGGIACYKAAELCRALIKAGATVQVVMTEAAGQFITPVTMQALSGRPVYSSQWDSRSAGGVANSMAHINLSREADAILIAPCR
jgi:phosphopantothenoylcysteine decarboxylase / phosphopantothenate---cysteine ligase